MPNQSMIDYQKTLLAKQKLLDSMIDGFEHIFDEGIEGIRLTASQQPEVILDTLVTLVSIIHNQHSELVSLCERISEIYDIIDFIEADEPQ